MAQVEHAAGDHRLAPGQPAEQGVAGALQGPQSHGGLQGKSAGGRQLAQCRQGSLARLALQGGQTANSIDKGLPRQAGHRGERHRRLQALLEHQPGARPHPCPQAAIGIGKGGLHQQYLAIGIHARIGTEHRPQGQLPTGGIEQLHPLARSQPIRQVGRQIDAGQ